MRLASAVASVRPVAALLACWLLLPTLAAAWLELRAGAGPVAVLSILAFALWLFALPLIFLGTARRLFLFWTPIAFLVPLQCYLIYFFDGVPGDAVTSSALHLSLGQALELLDGFGLLMLMLPFTWAVYLILLRKVDTALSLSTSGRKTLAALLLTYSMIGMHGDQTLKRYITMPPLFTEATGSATYPAGTALSLARVLKTEGAASQPMQLLNASASPSPLVVILVIGESVRPDHLGINGYARNTTPELAKIGADLMSFSDVASTANYTAGAVPNIVRRRVAGGNVSLVSIFREAGFRTAWFSNQQSDIFLPQADLTDFSDAEWHQGFRQDEDLLPLLRSCLQQCGKRQFIVLHMYGSHFPYDARYQRRDQQFSPVFRDAGMAAAAPRFKDVLVNSYDNTLFAADRFLAGVIASAGMAGKPALVLYTSDHGENLYDDERQLFMHIGPHPSRADTMVPMLFWANEAYRLGEPAKIASLRATLNSPLNHLAIMPTLLDLGGITYDGKDPAQSLASGQFTPVARRVAATSGLDIDVDSLR